MKNLVDLRVEELKGDMEQQRLVLYDEIDQICEDALMLVLKKWNNFLFNFI